MIKFKLPENFPFEKKPEDGTSERFLVEATYKKGEWDVDTVDGVPMNTAGKANAPEDDGIMPNDAAEEAAESPEEEASEDETAETPTPTAEMPEQADQSAGPSVGASFAKSVMNPSQ